MSVTDSGKQEDLRGMSIDELLPAVQERHRERFGRLMR